ncbi:DNA-3-methyladenine glycosylase 2 family protein [Corynebacterium pacaense]|uniref:DNA-3-methyladenine glycosylase 2 family protein n=1 Tax=Corynebacterium pacaense TaxID=1816684 RepID=UPI0009BB0545|nr:AlkA N-terminal domain-containing protein [Corynebacterium pacaense]
MTHTVDPKFRERYRAIDARDPRFDGQFFTAVSSTGIYCRPSCPARTPKPENVSFFLTSAAAQRAGYRACRRCAPEAAPGTPEWNIRGDTAARAMRLINDGVVDREGVAGLASRLGYSPRHLNRILLAELGAGSLALARARRAQAARSLIIETDLSMSRIAFAAGFTSVRQFNDTMLDIFGLRPGDLRRAGGTSRPSPTLGVELPVRQPFDAPGVFGFLAARAVGGVEVADLGDPTRLRYARTLTLPWGPGAVEVVAKRSARGWNLRAQLELTTLADAAPAVARVRRLLDLDADPVAVDRGLAEDPRLAALVERTPGIRVPGAVDPHELVVRAMVGQHISVAAARTHLTRLATGIGHPHASAFEGLDTLFPDPVEIVRSDLLRLPARSLGYLRATLEALISGELVVDVGADAPELSAQLLAQPGIGPWTSAYIRMRVLGSPDAWLHGDVALLAGASAIGLADADHRTLAAHADTWSPWRSYAAMHLWRAAAGRKRT